MCVAGAAVTGIGWGAASSQRLHAFWPNFCTKLSQIPEDFCNYGQNHGNTNLPVLVTIKSVLSVLSECRLPCFSEFKHIFHTGALLIGNLVR